MCKTPHCAYTQNKLRWSGQHRMCSLLQQLKSYCSWFSHQSTHTVSNIRTVFVPAYIRKFTINIAIHCISHILYEIYLQWARAVHIVHCCRYIVHCCFAAIHCVLLHCCRYIVYFCTVALVVVASSPLSHSRSCPISRFSRLVPKLFTEPALLAWFTDSGIFNLMGRRTHSDIEKYVLK